nr:MAG TPA: dUTPase [Caudoviricetes sp.]
MITIKTKLIHPNAKLPTRAHTTDAGFDLYCTHSHCNEFSFLICHSGIAIEIPEGHVGLIFPRSSIRDKDLSLTNSVGVIDSGYCGEITACFRVHPFEDGSVAYYDAGERFAQLIILPIPAVEFIEVEELNDNTDRGTNGYGSSGK